MWINRGWLLGQFPALAGISGTELRRIGVLVCAPFLLDISAFRPKASSLLY